MADELVRREAGELDEVADHVRLIEIAALEGDLRPAGRCAALREGERALEASHPAEALGRDPHLRGEHLDESPAAEAHLRSDRADAAGPAAEVVEREAN